MNAAASDYLSRPGSNRPMQNNSRSQYLQSKTATKRYSDDSTQELFSADVEDPYGGASLEAEEVIDNEGDSVEAFLTVQPGSKAARSLGSDNPAALLEVLQDVSKPDDMYFTKSHYSAFKSGLLIQTLRRHIITELFICGALSNTSVYATAMDAASHGMGITLVDDCLGWRGKGRHDHALASLDEATGCDMFASGEIMVDIQKKLARTTKKRPVRHQDHENLENMLGMLKLQSEASTVPKSEANDRKGELKTPKAQPSTAIGDFRVKDESLAAVTRPIRGAEVIRKPRVKSKIMQRRDFEEEKTKVKIENKPNKTTLTPSSSRGDMNEELPAKGQTLDNVETSSSKSENIQTETKTGSGDPPANIVVNSVEKRETAVKEPARTGSSDRKTSLDLTVEASSDMSRLAEGEPLCEGDTVVITNLLSSDKSDDIFETIKDEVQWQRMSHQGGEVPRLVAVQGEIGQDGEIPIYRHPADESPPLLAFSPAVSIIRREVEKATGHTVNHCLIQFYRDGKDYISEHSDKTLDVVPNTYIANASLGAERTMVFRGKRDPKDRDSTSTQIKPRNTVRASLPHNSMMRMGLVTNMRWMHSIRQDKRMEREKTAAELDFGGCRISLTFRLIGTFLNKDQSKIWGQGAVAKHKLHARSVVNGWTEEAKKMIEAFGIENRSSEFAWPEVYGQGFDVLHMSNTRKLLLSGNKFIDDAVRAALEHLGLEWTASSITAPVNAESGTADQLLIKLVDTDISRSTVQGHAAVLLYLDAVHGKAGSARTPLQYARLYTRLNLAASLATTNVKIKVLDLWETYAAEDEYMAGSELSIVDFAFFPLLHSVMQMLSKDDLPRLEDYYERMMDVDVIKRVLTSDAK